MAGAIFPVRVIVREALFVENYRYFKVVIAPQHIFFLRQRVIFLFFNSENQPKHGK